MKKLIAILALTFAGVSNAQQFNVDQETFDCDYAGDVVVNAANLKQDGMSLDNFKAMFNNIPKGSLKDMYVHYSLVGFQYSNSTDPYTLGYKLCQAERS